MKAELIQTSDGSKTLFVPELNEQYHSTNGALTESKHVFIQNGFLFHKSAGPVVFEVGFGTGLNCLLTAISAIVNKRPTTYYCIEKYPIEKEVWQGLEYGEIEKDGNEIYEKIHSCAWNQEVQIHKYFKLFKLHHDLKTFDFESVEKSDIIYFDAFGPDKQPTMWTPEIFAKIYTLTKTNGVFVTYSAKGQVRRDLTGCGFEMERIPGPPGKKQMLRGIKRD